MPLHISPRVALALTTLIPRVDGISNYYNESISSIARPVSFLKETSRHQASVGTSIGRAYLGCAVQYIEDVWDSTFASSLDRHVCFAYISRHNTNITRIGY